MPSWVALLVPPILRLSVAKSRCSYLLSEHRYVVGVIARDVFLIRD
jgi:hypothetical protein